MVGPVFFCLVNIATFDFLGNIDIIKVQSLRKRFAQYPYCTTMDMPTEPLVSLGGFAVSEYILSSS